MQVPLLDLTLQYRQIAADIQRVLPEVVESQQFILGPRVDRFEEEVARHLGVAHAIGCASGTDALLQRRRGAVLDRRQMADPELVGHGSMMAGASRCSYTRSVSAWKAVAAGEWRRPAREASEVCVDPAHRAVRHVRPPGEVGVPLGCCAGSRA